jgi:phosphohistidine phosphatase
VTLFLLRHGIAEDRTTDKPDRERTLTPRGRARMGRAAVGLRVLVERVDEIFTSPYPRAAETAAIAAATLAKGLKPRPLDALSHGTPPMEALRALRSMAKRERVMLVGHEPELSHLASLLLTGSIDGLRLDLKKGGCIAIAIRTLAPRVATLEWLATPRMLRKLGRARSS